MGLAGWSGGTAVQLRYRITSSAVASSVSGMVRLRLGGLEVEHE
jgi:hypothetical protein